MDTFTKGPWYVEDTNEPDEWQLRSDTPGNCEVAELHYTSEADARLIAAAPDLVEALREARETINRLIAWEGAVETCTPELGGLIAAMYHARAEIPSIDAVLKKAGA